jgi:hypothetical protein
VRCKRNKYNGPQLTGCVCNFEFITNVSYCSSLVLVVLVGCFLIFFCIEVCSLHILWHLC